jgi:hypothetical protein
MTCELYQQACYDLLDQTLSPEDERAVMEHVGTCPACQRFLEAEQARMRQWPRLLHVAARGVKMPEDALERVTHAMEVSHHREATRFVLASKMSAAPVRFPWRMLVASLTLLLGAAGILRLVWMQQPAEPLVMVGMESAQNDSVTLLRQQGAVGIVLPVSIPGRVSLAAGEMCLRLGSGVELTVVGPLELMLENPMLIRLEQGDLLAHVSPQASGFQVHTPRLHIWDLGTIFCVSARAESSKVFVFKGSVNVCESSGDAVDSCTAGQGVCARAGLSAFKVTADFEAVERDFGRVAGMRSLKNIQQSLTVADRVTTLWMERYLPKDEPARKAYLQKEVERRLALLRPAFSKQAWVQRGVPFQVHFEKQRVSQKEEEENMTTTRAVAAMAASATLLTAGMSGATSAPIQVDTAPYNNRHWMTVFTNEVPLDWRWPAAATQAELAITGMNTSFTTNLTTAVSNCVWRPFTGAVPQAEDVCDLTLTFRNSGSIVVGVLTSRLAVVKAAFGPTSVDTALPEKNWTTVKDSVVLPYDGRWTAATASGRTSQLAIQKQGGALQTNSLADASGYVGWKLKNSAWGFGTFDLTLTFPGTVADGWTATLRRQPDGTMITFQ